MERRRRKIMLSVFICAFVFGCAYLILITQGLTIDWKHATITKTGAIYLRSTPSNPKIYINGKSYASNDTIINKGTLIKNLVPGIYDVAVEKDGFSAWTKKITVEKGLVSSENFIALWKNNPSIEEIASSSIKNFWVIGGDIIMQDEKEKISSNEITIKGVDIIDYSTRTGTIITKDKFGNYFFTDITNPHISTNVQEIFNSLKQQQLKLPGITNITTVFPHPFSRQKIIIGTKTSVYIIDLKKVSIEKIITVEDIEHIYINETSVFIRDVDGNIATVNLFVKNEPEIVYSTSTNIHTLTLNNTYLLFLDDSNTLFAYERATNSLTIIAKRVKQFSLSPDEKRGLILFENNTLAISYLTDYSGNTLVEKGTLIKLSLNQKIKEQVEKIEWISTPQNHMAIFTKNSVLLVETDERNPQNTYLLSNKIKKCIIDGDFYILENNGSLKKVEY